MVQINVECYLKKENQNELMAVCNGTIQNEWHLAQIQRNKIKFKINSDLIMNSVIKKIY